MATDNTVVSPSGDSIRDLARQAGSVKTQVMQLDLGGGTGNAEVLIAAGQQVMAASVPVVIASNQASIPVTLTSTTITGAVAVAQSGTWNIGSITTLPALVAGSAVIGKAGIDQTTPGTTNLVALTAETTKVIGTVNPPAITKATQGANGFTTQDLKDAGRSARTITLDSFAVAATTETLNTMSYSTDNATLTTGTSYTVTSGKRFRVQQITASLSTVAGNTTAVGVIVRVRVNNGGAAAVSSPMQAVLTIQGQANLNVMSLVSHVSFPDGWEFVAGAGIGVTTTCPGFVATTAAPKVNITITGYEY